MTNPESEIWKPIPGVERYEASTLGNVRHRLRMIPLKKQVNPAGYFYFGYVDVENKSSKSYKTRGMFFHQAVALAFHGIPEEPGLVVMHLDNDKKNNTPGNLKWGTRAENNAQAIADGLHGPSAKTHCKKGHPLSGENLRYQKSRNRRICRTCHNESNKRSYWIEKNSDGSKKMCGVPRKRDGLPCEKMIPSARDFCGFHARRFDE